MSYVDRQGNTTTHGTLQKLTVGVQAGALQCVSFGFAATPNPIISPTLAGTTNITAIVANVLFTAPCPFDIRVGSPSGTLFLTATDAVDLPAGSLGNNRMQVFPPPHGEH